jgi:hypothetical protein
MTHDPLPRFRSVSSVFIRGEVFVSRSNDDGDSSGGLPAFLPRHLGCLLAQRCSHALWQMRDCPFLFRGRSRFANIPPRRCPLFLTRHISTFTNAP